MQPLMPHSVIQAVNFCETVPRLRRGGMPLEPVTVALMPLVTPPIPFDEPPAYVTASSHERTRGQGLYSGDCAGPALALSRNVPAVPAERKWDEFDVGVRVIKIREAER